MPSNAQTPCVYWAIFFGPYCPSACAVFCREAPEFFPGTPAKPWHAAKEKRLVFFLTKLDRRNGSIMELYCRGTSVKSDSDHYAGRYHGRVHYHGRV